MWIPKSADEVLDRLNEGGIDETARLDGKRELPDPRANVELAVDVCAMTVEGGSILIGVGENADGTRLTEPQPIELAGVRERVDQIVGTSISEPPTIDIRALPDDENPARGFVAIVVPPSPRAPHQIVSRGMGGKYYGRYYGRSATGNRILSQSEVDALYARRRTFAELDAEAEAEQELRKISSVAFTSNPGRVFASFLTRPISMPAGLFERLEADGARSTELALRQAVEHGLSAHPETMSPDLRSVLEWRREDADHYASTYFKREKPELHFSVSDVGVSSLVSRRVGDALRQGTVVFEDGLAALLTTYVASVAAVHQMGGYAGLSEIGIVIRPLTGVLPYAHYQEMDLDRRYPTEEYRRSSQFLTGAMSEDPARVARDLLQPLLEALVGRGYDPLRQHLQASGS